jgi:hypothetical protein
MSEPDPLAKLRRFVPLLSILVVLQAVALGYGLIVGVGPPPGDVSSSNIVVTNPAETSASGFSAPRIPGVWPLVLGDLVFSGVLLFVLWRKLGRSAAKP